MTELDPNNRAAWEADRRNYIGASDAAAVLGLSPWATPIDVWLQKTGRGAPKPQTIATRRGAALEDLIGQLWSERAGLPIWKWKAGTVPHPDLPHVAATPDFLVWHGLVECKDVGQYVARDWANGAPQHVTVQTMVQMAVTGMGRCDIAALISGRADLYIQTVHASPLDQRICEALEAWWVDHVIADKPPALIGPPARDKEALAVLYPEGSGAVVARDEHIATVIDLGRLKALRKGLDDEIATAENSLREAIGPCVDLLHPETGASIASWPHYTRSGVTNWDGVATVMAVDPETLAVTIAEHTPRITYRVLRTNTKRATQ